MRHACEGRLAELHRRGHEEAINGLLRANNDGSGAHAPQYCVEGPPARCRQNEDGFNGRDGFAVGPVYQIIRLSINLEIPSSILSTILKRELVGKAIK